jgi:predicted CoA-binding protein
VVGLSKDPEKMRYKVSDYLKQHGFLIVPVNPFVDEVLGEKCYKSLLDIPVEIQKTIDIVDIFRKAEMCRRLLSKSSSLKTKLADLSWFGCSWV